MLAGFVLNPALLPEPRPLPTSPPKPYGRITGVVARRFVVGYLESMDLDDLSRALLRHMLATLAYRGGKTIRDAPPGFGAFLPAGGMNTPLMLLAHICDLIEWAHRWSLGDLGYRVSEPLGWEAEAARFYSSLASFDRFLESGEQAHAPLESLFQAPIADALTHIGQLALLRRMAGDPVPGEAYRLAGIVAGCVGPEQAPPVDEFERDKGAIWRGSSGR